jgi:hypothetical protein
LYAGVNDTHLTELLARNERLHLGRETVRSLLRHAGLPPKRRRRPRKYRSRRERKEAFGMMLQIDGSPHAWLEDRGPRFTLVGAKDDATGYVWARFCEAETTWAYLDLMREVIASHGVPASLYSDRHSIFHAQREPTVVEQLKDSGPMTQFGRAMHELGVQIHEASSPQAKGRIERQWGVFQDRLVVEMRLAAVSTMEQANAFLVGFLADYNRRFTVEPALAASVFRPAPANLDDILCLKETRSVSNDHTISVDGLVLQIPPTKLFRSLARRRVEVLQRRDGALHIQFQRRTVATFGAPAITRLVTQLRPGRSELRLLDRRRPSTPPLRRAPTAPRRHTAEARRAVTRQGRSEAKEARSALTPRRAQARRRTSLTKSLGSYLTD